MSWQNPFAVLLASNGTIFRIETIKSALWLSFELYRSTDSDEYMETFINSSQVDESINQELLVKIIRLSEESLRRHELAGSAFLIPSLVLEHVVLLKRWSTCSQDYAIAMHNTGRSKLVNTFT